ncbi:MAG TPA: type II toxin-antitoxin system VapC family toxin [Allosphingosinicella sp.]|nr:type II toxin-antitoxin system VapC family toxin [Allosphingosinicella sp.]
MRAIDTNVLVRFLTGDDRAQAARAGRLVEAGDIFVATSVLLETEWVLRSGYGLAAGPIVEALRGFAGLPGVTLEDPPLAARALDWAEQGLDFAEALHLGRAQGCSVFMSFDRKLAGAAAGLSDVEIAAP